MKIDVHVYALILFHILLFVKRDTISKMLKGKDGILQTAELTTGVCLYFLCTYSIIAMYDPSVTEVDDYLMGVYVLGSGIGSGIKAFKDTKTNNNEKRIYIKKKSPPAG